MAADTNGTARELLAGAFGFDRDEPAAHFLVRISEHLSWNTERVGASAHLSLEREDTPFLAPREAVDEAGSARPLRAAQRRVLGRGGG